MRCFLAVSLGFVGLVTLLTGSTPAWPWGDTGHAIMASMTAKILETESPSTLKKIDDLLAADTDNTLTDHDIASQARWADAYRESSDEARALSSEWHFVDIDFDT